MTLAAVVIGRNEGARLEACLASLATETATIIYVDSGSTDGSVSVAKAAGADVISLPMDKPFTAARARNAGAAMLPAEVEMIQFLDGDCTLRAGWIVSARRFLADNPQVAVVCGRRRERAPEASVYNGLVDREWDTAIGETKACGGDALIRADAFRQAGGYRENLIAGEEPELCLRLRQLGWKIWRLDAEMTWHDAQITRFSQWWRRSRRAGHAFAEGAALHGAAPEHHWVRETQRAILWGGILPVSLMVAAIVISPWALIVLLIYPLQAVRLATKMGWTWGIFTVLGKFPEALGVIEYHLRRLRGGNFRIIEYK
ncbi:Glycosyltransferase, GT2 family [Sulfitobacter brevis]|uniref:Glycosyltransferase, GT2 family n=1 Tax=Sulfitobacter brevis TaxID=74348 RepID=A0A1I2AN19_9RHOB|nr:glycosyltransferase [Sulfitobacter brevis]SFE45302.1 Glycosyltransferase, GT2 family [Sulfitobacter brevis]